MTAKAKHKPKPSPKPATKAKAAPKEEAEELYNISRLAEYFELDRATMRRRLEDAGVKPVKKLAKETRYRLEDAEAAMQEDDAKDLVQLRKLDAEASLKELELARARGEVLPRKEVEDQVQRLFSAMYQRVCVRFPREIGAQLFKADTTTQLTTTLQRSLQSIFNELRTDHSRYLGGD